jgi:hypothetical protein
MRYFGTRARLFKITQFQDPAVKRMLRKLRDIDKAALPEDELQEVIDRAPGLQAHAPLPQGWVGGSVRPGGGGNQSVWSRRGMGGERGDFSQAHPSWLLGLVLGVGPRAQACPG